MGLVDSIDWTAQWLAVEDSIARADREASVKWIWGASPKSASRKFRFKFKLPAASRAGELFAVANAPYGKIQTIWIDDTELVAPRSEYSSGEWLALNAMDSGEHHLAVEVVPPTGLLSLPSAPRRDGLILFARLSLENGESLRVGTSESWTTSLTQDATWHTPQYEDEDWERSCSACIQRCVPWPPQTAMYVRRGFCLEKPIEKARLYVTALGGYEPRLNGRRVGDALLTPEPSQYTKRLLYRVHDVTGLLLRGANALGLLVGDGWYASGEGRYEWGPAPRRVIAQLEVVFEDGSQQIIATGSDWRLAESPVRRSQVRIGEIYDARLEQLGWDNASFDDSHWSWAVVAARPPCRLVAQTSPPIRRMQIIKAKSISRPQPDTYVIDFGCNVAGWCRLHVQEKRGQRIELRFGETLSDSGDLAPHTWAAMGDPKKDIYICRGDAAGETFEPHFTYRGFRYVHLTGQTSAPTAESIEAVVIQTDLERTGDLRCSEPLIEAIWRTTVRTQRCNFVGIPTDCPSREQRGYLEDCGYFWDAATFNMDVCAFGARQMDNAVDGQLPDGVFPTMAPWPLRLSHIIAGPPGWGEGVIMLAWVAWRRYGDISLIEQNWDAMNSHVQFIQDHNPEYLWKNKRGLDFGDWLATDQLTFDPQSARVTPKELIGTAYWAHAANLLAQMAGAIGLTKESVRLGELFERVRQAFNAAYVRCDGTVGDGSQTCYVLALHFGLLPQDLRPKAADRLAAEVRDRGVALTTGFLGTQFILDVLTDAGFTGLAYGLLLREEYPSWGYMLKQGATTLWESWSGEIEWEGERTKISQNHFALGGICGFLFRRVAGVDAAEPGFEMILVRPALDSRLRSCGADYNSIMGWISTDWTWSLDGRLTLDITIPANTTAQIHLPAHRDIRIEEGGQEIVARQEIRVLARSDHDVVIAIGSGRYCFRLGS
jgi:alpha-L-rhamnosidase